MTLSEYQYLASRTIRKDFVTDDLRNHSIFGLCSEAGEVASLYQHHLQDGKPVDLDTLMKELGDALWFVSEVATAWGLDLEVVGQANIAKLKKRFPEGFDEERSIHRHEYD